MIIRRTSKTGLRFFHQIEPLEARIAPATFLVTSIADSGPGTLRQAIVDANATTNIAVPDVINFNLGTGPFKIQPLTQLPDITEAVIIDGYSQAGATANTLPTGSNANLIIELSGALLSSGNGLVLAGANGGSTVKGLAIHSFGTGVNESGYGIIIESNNNRVEGNFIGTDATGVADLSTENKNAGVRVGAFGQTTPLYTGNVIGGTTAAAKNVLTGNAYGVQLDEQSFSTQILGNLIGLDKSGNTAYGNTQAGISDFGGTNTFIGDSTANGRNIISGSGGPGIAQGGGVTPQIRGNYIGTNAAGTAALGNTGAGIRITNDASGGLIEGNYISGNVAGGIQLGSPVGDGGAFNFEVRGNFIGISSGGSPVPNDGPGVAFFQGASGHIIGKTAAGQDNIIAFNKGAGIQDFGGGTNNRFYRNNINSNGGLEIDRQGFNEDFFGVTPNDSPDVDGVTNWPVIQTFNNTGSAVTLTGSLNALTNATYRVEFFLAQRAQVDLSGHGGGVSFIGFQDVTTNGAGAGTFNFNIGLSAPPDSFFTATATPMAGGSTSEFGPTTGPTASYTWTGATNSDWFTPGNWSPAVVPSPLDSVTFASGTISLTGPAAVANFTHTGGTLAGTGELTARDALTWSGGTHTGGTLRLATSGTGTIGTGGAALTWSGGVLENFGALTVSGLGVDFNQGSLVNGAQTAVVTLNARLTDSDGAGTVATVSNGGTIVKMGSGSFGFGGINVSNSETIRAEAGTLVVGGITQSSGVLELAGGGIFSTGPISLNGGELVGAGTITGNVSNSGGTVYVGGKGAAGTLNIAGNYSQGSTGFLKVDLGGTTPGTQHDRLNVTGNTGLDGALEHELLGTFVVRVGDSFSVLSSGTLGGTFNSTIGSPPIPTVYAGGLVSLTAVGFNVTNTNDSGAGSLRQAILDANAQPGLDYISFNIPGGGLKTIAPLTVLPSIGDDTVIDAYSQPGSVLNTLAVGSNAAPLIELSGVNVPGTGGFESGLVAASGNVTISGFIINRWADYGITVTTPTNGSTITGNWIGTDSTGNSAPTNTQTGIFIENAPFISVGSTLPRGRNLISGNNGYGVHVSGASSTSTFIQGNYIGTNAAGGVALGNGLDGVRMESGSNFIGGGGDGSANVISGNLKAGIVILGPSASGNTIQGNLIGTNASGTAAVSNNDRGIKLVASSGTTIGGSFHDAGNVISGNLAGGFQGEGILVDGSQNNIIQGNFIGTNKAGTASIGLQSYGIELANGSIGNRIGGSANSGGNEGNVISGNLNGGIIISGNSDGAIIEGNRIGTDEFGVGALGNGGAGIAIIVASNCIIGGTPETANIIAFNAGPGVQVIDAAASGNTIRGNSIYSNTGLGIDLGSTGVTANDALDADSGANGLLNFPTLSTYIAGAMPLVTGTYSGLANQTFTLDFYASNTADPSGNGEGRYYLGAAMVTTNGSGMASFTAPLNGFIPAGGVISATATQSSNFNTSEFSGVISTSTTRTWDAGGGGNTDWFTAANWSGDVVPGAGDTAILNTNATITLSGNASVFTFTQSTGTLTGTGTLTVSNDFGWSGGTQSGTGVTKIPVGALWNLTSNTGNMILDGRTVNLDGTANFTGTGPAFLNNGATINNAGTFLFANNNDLGATSGAGTFNNLIGAVVQKSAGTGLTDIGVIGAGNSVFFNNAGTLGAQVGTLRLNDGGTDTAGIFNAAPGAKVQFQEGTRTVNGATVYQGGGIVLTVNATLNLNNTVTLSGSGTDFQIGTGATVNIVGSVTTQAGAAFDLNGGTVTGSGSLSVSGSLLWDAGTLTGSGTTSVLVGGTLQFATSADKTLDGRTLDVAGSTNLSNGRLLLNNGAIFNNSGVLQVFGDPDINSAAGAGAFNNLTGAVFRKVSGATITEVGSPAGGDVAFSNAGTVEVQSGTLQFSDTFTQSAGSTIFSGGVIEGASGMTFAGGVVTGTGTFIGNINNTGAVFRPGGSGAAGSIQIFSGSYTQGAGGTLAVELGGTGAGQFDVLSVGSGSTLDGTLDIALINGFSVGAGNSFRVVQSSGNPGTFSTLTGATAGLAQAADATGLVIASTASATYVWDGEASNDWFNPINWNLNSGVPGPSDTAILNINATITPSGAVTVGTFQQAAGSISGNPSVTVLNAFDWSGGTVDLLLTLGSGGTSTISGTAAKLITGAGGSRGIVNQGTINYSSTGTLDFQNGGFLSNEVGSTFNLTSDATMTHTGGGGSFFGVAGTFNKAGGTGASTFGTTNFSNTGTMNVQSGSMEITGVIATGAAGGPNGSFNVGTGATVTFSGDANFVNTTFFGTGTKRFTGGNIGLSGNIVAGGLEIASGTWTGTSTITDTLTWTAGNLVGLPTIAVGGTLNLSGSGLKFISGSGGFNGFINEGTMIWSGTGDFQIENGGFVDNRVGATFEARANASIFQTGPGASNFVNSGTFVRSVGTGTASVLINFITTGIVRPESGTLAFDNYSPTSGSTVLGGGTLSSANLIVFQGGELRGTGTIEGTVLNSGATVRPGGAGVAGTIAITGNFGQGTTGTLSAELGGAGGGQSDALSVGGAATLGGLLEVSFINGYAPVFGDTLNVVTAGNRSGTFNNTQGTSLLTVGYTATQAQLVRSAANLSWDGGGGDTNWFNPMNWNPDFVPTANDNASLTVNAVINLPSNASVASYSQTTGVLGGAGDLTVTGFFNWNGGQLDGGGGKLILPNGSSSGLSVGPWDLRRSVVQGGNFTIAASNELSFSGGLLFENSGSVFLGSNNINIEARNGGGGTFRNLPGGALVVNATDTQMIGGFFDNNGTVNLSANTSFKTTYGNSSGTWNLAAGSTFTFDHSFLSTTLTNASFTGSGAVVVQGSSDLAFPVGSTTTFGSGVSFTQTNGQLVGPGSVSFAGTASLSGVALTSGVSATFTATSTLTNMNGGLSGGSLLNTAGTSSFNGGFTFSGGSVLTNSGALTIPNGAVADFINSSGGGSIVNATGAMFIKLPSGNNTAIQVPFANSGMVSVAGQMSFTTFTQTTSGASLVLNGGVISGAVVLNGGAFSGVGSHVAGSVTNAGAVVRPGGLGARGTLHANSYEQQSGGSLEIEIASASDFDVLDLTGATTLGGGLSIDTVVPFLPANGNTFRVVTTAAIPSGNFATFTGDVTRLSRSVDVSGVLLAATTLTYVWDNSAGDDDWFNPLNWDLDSGTPGAADTAVISIPSLVNLSTSVTVSAFVQSDGSFSGVGSLSVTDNFTWSGGSIALPVTSGIASINSLGGTATMALGSLLDLGGTSTLGGTFGINLTGSNAELRNSGAFAFTGDAGISGTGAFHNLAGSAGVSKTGDAEVIIDVVFLNGAALTVSEGTLSLQGGGSWLSNISATVGSAAVLNFKGGTHTFAGDNQFFGAGSTQLDGATLEFNGNGATVDVAHSIKQISGNLGGTGEFKVAGKFFWEGGTQDGTASTTVLDGGELSIATSADKTMDQRTLRSDLGGSVMVFGDGPVSMANGSSIVIGGAMNIGTAAAFNDAGGALSSIDILSSGTFDKLDTGTTTISVQFFSEGSLHFSDGGVNFLSTFTQMAGSTALNGGGIGFSTPGELRGGILTGDGTITGSLNHTGGILNPGVGPGSISITGDYIQSSVATLQLELTGTTVASGYDQLQVGGNASLDGSVSVFLAGFTPARGDTFRIITAGSVSGTFTTLDLPDLFEADYTAISVDLSLPFLPPGVISLGELDETDGFLIPGLTNGSATGNSVSAIGDINGDTIGDFAIGAPNENGGTTYVVFGKTSSFGSTLDLSTLDGTNGFTIIDSVNGGRSGFSLSGLGDVNGDGIADIFIGAPDSAVSASNAGAAYILFGKETSFTATVDLGTATGSSVLQIVGVGADDLAGFSVSNAGDINNDGASDILIGVPFADLNGADSGAAYVVFGVQIGTGTLPASISLSGLDGTAGFRLVGEQANDHFGTSVSTAGDINHDGFADLIIGAPGADSFSGLANNGAAYVFLGKATGFTASTDVSTFDGKNGFKIEGLWAGEAFGSSVATAGDMNGDGVSDIVIGAANPGTGQIGQLVTGNAYVIFGKKKTFKPTFDLSTLDGDNGFRLTTASLRSNLGTNVSSAGDFNNDGFDDIVVGAPSAEDDAGITYILLGRKTGFAAELDLEMLTGTTGFRFVGGTVGGQSGTSVSGGDINGDGFDDIIIGSPQPGSESQSAGTGGAIVLYGHATRAIPVVPNTNTTAVFEDDDQDKITITVTGGKITADMLTFGADGGLQMVDLTEGEYKDGSSITFSVKKKVGDGIFNVGAINATGIKLGKVSVTGDLGHIDAGNGDPLKNAIKFLNVGSLGAMGGTTQIPGTDDPLISTIRGALPKVMVKGNVTNATLNVLGKLGSFTVGGSFTGTGAFSSSQLAGLAALGHTQLGQVSGGTTLASSGLSAGSIGKLTVKGGLTNSAISSSSSISSATINGDFTKSALVAATTTGAVKVLGRLIGDATTPSVISARGPLSPTSQAKSVAISSLTIKGDVSNAEILIGYDKTFVPTNGDASIGNVTINGNWTASSLVAGIKDDTDNGFGLADVPIPGFDATPTVFSRIASLIIKGTVTSSSSLTDTYAITAQQIGKVKINGTSIVLDKLLPDNLLLAPTDDLRLVEVF